MNLTISFNFEGGQNFEVIMNNAELKKFLTTIHKNEVYWDEKGGFWLAFNKLLYFSIKEIKNEVGSKASEIRPSNRMEQESEDFD